MITKKPKPCSVLSIDVGHKRIGIAGCDPLGITIKALPPLHRGKFEDDFETLRKHCKARLVKGLIVGIPLNLNGDPTKQTVYCCKYGKKIAHALELPIALVNEHSSSWAASDIYKLRKDRSGELDSAAAVLLLEQWLREGPELKPVQLAAPLISKKIRNVGS